MHATKKWKRDLKVTMIISVEETVHEKAEPTNLADSEASAIATDFTVQVSNAVCLIHDNAEVFLTDEAMDVSEKVIFLDSEWVGAIAVAE